MSDLPRTKATPRAGAEVAAARPWRRAFAWLAFLGPFFFATYGFANWLASRRTDVPAIVFDWEHRIPFLAWTIVPYWSIDLLYAVSLFICTSRRELDTHAKRLLGAQIACVLVFVLFPLRFSFERPEPGGGFGLMFDVLMGFDKPFNQMPSLHIALLVIVWLRFTHHVVGGWKWVAHGWATLIAVSVLTTYQHHFVDLVTGFWVGCLCLWLFPESGEASRVDATRLLDARRRILAIAYASGASVLGGIAFTTGGWALWLLWPSAALALVAIIYALLDEAAFQKGADGSASFAAWWLLAPYFAAAWLNSRWWTRRTTGADVVVPGVFLGRLPWRSRDPSYKAIVDLTAELPCVARFERYSHVPQLDLTVAGVSQIRRGVAAIDDAVAHGPVLVCCALGFSRSAVIVAAWLIRSGHASTVCEAVSLIRKARPQVVLGRDHITALKRYSRECCTVSNA